VRARNPSAAPMRASETAAGTAWLVNFADVDRASATMLLDSLRFATLTTVSSGLQLLLAELVESGRIDGPVLAVPERALSEFDLAEDASEPPVAFDDFLPGAPISVTPGSEGLVGRLLRDFAEAGGRTRGAWIAPDADLERLRGERARSIVIATDYIGSGNQLLALAAAIARNRTIRSWHSLGRIELHAVAFAATPAALDRIRRSREVAQAWAVEGAPAFATAIGWESETRAAIRQLCLTETRINRRWALGYKGTGGLFASEHGAPNPGRAVPPEVARELGDLRPQPPRRAIAERVGQLRIGRNERLNSMPPTSDGMLKVLLLLAGGPRGDEFLAAQLGVDVARVLGLRDALEQLGLVEPHTGRITDRGRSELQAQKRARRRTSSGIIGSDEPYYPASLR
jgi:hypothetical protein